MFVVFYSVNLYTCNYYFFHILLSLSVVYREGGFGVFKPTPEIPKISVESSIA